MSRTHKDTPSHVTATWWEPWHVRCEHEHTNRSVGSSQPAARVCDLPAEPSARHYRETFRPGRCTWWPMWQRHHYPNPPHWFITHVWSARERLAARVDCLNAAKEYRGQARVDTVPTTRQNRHCAQWLWG